MKATRFASDPAGYHDWFSPSYVDDWIDRDAGAAARRPALETLVAGLDLPADAACRVLDVGGGWGSVTRCVLDAYPMATVVLVDFSEPMLDRAAQHLASDLARVRFVQADLRDENWLDEIDNRFEAIVSSLAIHNVREAAVVERVYRDLAGITEAGGVLADLDLTDGHSVADRRAWIENAGFARVTVDENLGGPGTTLFRGVRP